LQRQKADAGADPAGTEQCEAGQKTNRMNDSEQSRHRIQTSRIMKATAERVAAPTMNCGTVVIR
jgi:hypothetical protein